MPLDHSRARPVARRLRQPVPTHSLPIFHVVPVPHEARRDRSLPRDARVAGRPGNAGLRPRQCIRGADAGGADHRTTGRVARAVALEGAIGRNARGRYARPGAHTRLCHRANEGDGARNRGAALRCLHSASDRSTALAGLAPCEGTSAGRAGCRRRPDVEARSVPHRERP